MNKKIGMFFLSITLMVGYGYSQEFSDAAAYDDTEQLESSPSDQLEAPDSAQDALEQSPESALVDPAEESEDFLSEGAPYEPTPDELKELAGDEANKDLVNFAEILDTKKTMPEASETPIIEGIDTVDLEQPQGNWLFKRIWWERSEERYEKIKKKIEEIFEQRMVFFAKRSELVKNILDPFYIKIGMGQGEFQAILGELMQSLEKEREKKGALSAQEREFLTRLDNEREALEQLAVDVQAIGEVENRVDEALSRLLEQLNAIRRFDKQAWDAFKEIARVVDDEKARQLYSEIDTAAHNIKDIGDYLEHAFAAHFDQLIATAKDQTDRVTSMVAGLKEKGIDLKKRIEQLMAPQAAVKKMPETKEEEEIEEEPGFFSSYIVSPLVTAWNGIVWVVTWPYYAVFGEKEEVLEPEEE